MRLGKLLGSRADVKALWILVGISAAVAGIYYWARAMREDGPPKPIDADAGIPKMILYER